MREILAEYLSSLLSNASHCAGILSASAARVGQCRLCRQVFLSSGTFVSFVIRSLNGVSFNQIKNWNWDKEHLEKFWAFAFNTQFLPSFVWLISWIFLGPYFTNVKFDDNIFARSLSIIVWQEFDTSRTKQLIDKWCTAVYSGDLKRIVLTTLTFVIHPIICKALLFWHNLSFPAPPLFQSSELAMRQSDLIRRWRTVMWRLQCHHHIVCHQAAGRRKQRREECRIGPIVGGRTNYFLGFN